jgi:hypothetical protein
MEARMNRRNFFRFAWALILLLTLSMGCKLVNEAQELMALATDVQALATDIDLESLATDIDLESLVTDVDIEGVATDIDLEGLVTDVDMNELATEMAPLITEMGSILTDMPGFEGTLIPVSTPSGFPDDIPVMEGQKFEMSGSATRLDYTVDADINAAVEFYRREMAARGWAEGSSNVGEGEASLVFQKGSRRATVGISEDFLFGIAIEIAVEG